MEKLFGKYHGSRGEAYMQTGQYQRAVYDFSAAVKYDEQNVHYYGEYYRKIV